MKFRLLAVAFIVLFLFASGCPSLQPVTFVNKDLTTGYAAASDCDSCACLVCQRPEVTGGDIEEGPTGVSKDYLAKSGGGLSGSHCWFQTCGAKLAQQIKEDSSLYQVPFKIGVGQDVDGPLHKNRWPLSTWQFRLAVQYCPMTDKWCGFAAPGTKDRWQNVLRSYGFDNKFLMNDFDPNGDNNQQWFEDPVHMGLPTIPQFDWITRFNLPDSKTYVADHGADGYPFPNIADSAYAGKELPTRADMLCLFQGPYDAMTAAGSKYYGAPASLFCASGNCNKMRSYDSMCRKDSGNGILDYSMTGSNSDPQKYIPDDSTDCRCRTVRFYNEENALNYPSQIPSSSIGFTDTQYTPDHSAKDILPGGSQEWCRAYPGNLGTPELTPLFYPSSGVDLPASDKLAIWSSPLKMRAGIGAADYADPLTGTIETDSLNLANLPLKNCASTAKSVKGECAAYYENPNLHTICITGGNVFLDPGSCIGGTSYQGTLRYCIEWAITDGGECAMTDDSSRLDLLEYGICDSCLPAMDLVPVGGNYKYDEDNFVDFGTNLIEDLRGTEGHPSTFAHTAFLQMGLLPVIDTRAWPDTAKDSIAKPSMTDQNEYSYSGRIWRDGEFPVIWVLDRNTAYTKNMARLIKHVVLSDPSNPNSVYGNCPPVFDAENNIMKQSCLVGVDDSWKIGTDWNIGDSVDPWASTTANDPIPAGYKDSVDLVVEDVTLSTCVTDAQFGDVLTALIKRAKDVQSIHTDKPIGWLLYLRFPVSDCGYGTGKAVGAIDMLANAGYIGVIASFKDPPDPGSFSNPETYFAVKTPYDTATFNTLLHTLADPTVFSDRIDITADSNNQAFYNFFMGCSNYYNGTKELYYIKQSPSVCQCQFCAPGDTCDPASLQCKTTGLSVNPFDPFGLPVDPNDLTPTGVVCRGPTLEKVPAPNSEFKCSPGCVPFPIPDYSEDPEKYNTNADPGYGLDYDCTGVPVDPADTHDPYYYGTKQLYGCYVFCNKKLVNDAGVTKAVPWYWPAASGPERGLVEPQPGYNAVDATLTKRYTPTNCYMFDETTGSFYIYREMMGGNPMHRSYPVFDAQGKDNECGLSSENLATFLAEQSANQAMPSIVVR